jgi:hypothetical protein
MTLEPCPNCGAPCTAHEPTDRQVAAVYCTQCPLGLEDNGKTVAKLTTVWNGIPRVPRPAPALVAPRKRAVAHMPLIWAVQRDLAGKPSETPALAPVPASPNDRKSAPMPCSDEVLHAMDTLLEGAYWPQTLGTAATYARRQDEIEGGDQTLAVSFSSEGDACLTTGVDASLRFKIGSSGG